MSQFKISLGKIGFFVFVISRPNFAQIPHDRYNIRGIAHVRTNRKDDIFMQRRLGQILHVYWSGGKGLVKNQDRTRPELTQP